MKVGGRGHRLLRLHGPHGTEGSSTPRLVDCRSAAAHCKRRSLVGRMERTGTRLAAPPLPVNDRARQRSQARRSASKVAAASDLRQQPLAGDQRAGHCVGIQIRPRQFCPPDPQRLRTELRLPELAPTNHSANESQAGEHQCVGLRFGDGAGDRDRARIQIEQFRQGVRTAAAVGFELAD